MSSPSFARRGDVAALIRGRRASKLQRVARRQGHAGGRGTASDTRERNCARAPRARPVTPTRGSEIGRFVGSLTSLLLLLCVLSVSSMCAQGCSRDAKGWGPPSRKELKENTGSAVRGQGTPSDRTIHDVGWCSDGVVAVFPPPPENPAAGKLCLRHQSDVETPKTRCISTTAALVLAGNRNPCPGEDLNATAWPGTREMLGLVVFAGVSLSDVSMPLFPVRNVRCCVFHPLLPRPESSPSSMTVRAKDVAGAAPATGSAHPMDPGDRARPRRG